MDSDVWTDSEVRRVIQDRLGCGIDQAENIIKQSMPIESIDYIYEMFLKNIDINEIQDDVFENIIENEIQQDVFQNINSDAFYCNDDIYEKIERRALRETLEILMGKVYCTNIRRHVIRGRRIRTHWTAPSAVTAAGRYIRMRHIATPGEVSAL